MRTGLSGLVHPATLVSEVDLGATRAERERLREQVRLRAHLVHVLSDAPIDEDLVRVTPFEVIDGGCDDVESAS